MAPHLAAASDRDRERFRTLYRSELGYVCRSLRRFGVHECDLEDVAQELFVTLFRKLEQYDPARPIRPWLTSFAHRFASNYKQLARHREVGTRVRVFVPPQQEEDHAKQELVLRALEAVRDERLPVLTMHDLDGFTAHEIAEAMEIPLATVYSRLRLARAEFREAVRQIRAAEVPDES